MSPLIWSLVISFVSPSFGEGALQLTEVGQVRVSPDHRFDTMASSIDACMQIIDDPKIGKSLLSSRGWVDTSKKSKAAKVYSEAENGYFSRNSEAILFSSTNSSLGRKAGGITFNICEYIFVSSAKTPEIVDFMLKHYGTRNLPSSSGNSDIEEENLFKVGSHAVSIAKITKEVGRYRALVVPAPRQP